MRVLNYKDTQLFKQIASLDEKTLLKTLDTFLAKRYDKVISTDQYVVAEGNIPVALVAHLDTVFTSPPEVIYHDREMNVMWSPDGLGADDRAGVFAILKIVRAGLKPHIILTTGEEVGGKGAKALVKHFPRVPFKELKYMIELDRQGLCDCVFYSCKNNAFTEYIESFDFMEDWGTFSDISILCPEWGVAGVNLSVGYMHEHTYVETLHLNALLSTIKKVVEMLKDADNIEPFNYIHSFMNPFKYNFSSFLEDDIMNCDCCGKAMYEFEMVPVKGLSGQTKFYCSDCISRKNIAWCSTCYEAFELEEGEQNIECRDCRKVH